MILELFSNIKGSDLGPAASLRVPLDVIIAMSDIYVCNQAPSSARERELQCSISFLQLPAVPPLP